MNDTRLTRVQKTFLRSLVQQGSVNSRSDTSAAAAEAAMLAHQGSVNSRSDISVAAAEAAMRDWQLSDSLSDDKKRNWAEGSSEAPSGHAPFGTQ